MIQIDSSRGEAPQCSEAESERHEFAHQAQAKGEPDGSGWFDPKGEYRFVEDLADRAVQFFPRFLRHTKGEHAGRAFALRPWQIESTIRPLFGWYKRIEGRWVRKYRMVWKEIPRKNGKSTEAAGVGLLLTFADGEAGAEVYSTAADRDQAAVVFGEARRMRDADQELRSRSLAYAKSLVVPKLGASYKVLSADAGTKHGLNAHGIINDEVHAHRTRELYDVMHTSTGARRQPVEFNITTAGFDRHSIAWELHDYALKVAAGIIQDDSCLAVIYAADAEDDWTSPAIWAKANPNLGVSISLDALRKECERAQAIPGYENTFKRLHLNLWTEQASRWLPMDAWDECAGEIDAHELERQLRGRAAWAGIDLSSTADLSAFVMDIPLDGGGHAWIARFWMPADNIRKRVERDRVPYDVWVREGWIKATDGNVVDYDVIRADINALAEIFELRELPIDRWNATQLTTQLQGDGFTVVPFGQGFASLSAPSKELEKLVLGRVLVHGGNPVLRWMASNVAVTQDAAGNIKPAKDKSGEKIDGIVAGIMGLGRATVNGGEGASVYETRGVIVL